MKSFHANKNDRILIVAPHPDDESIGCGALIEKYADICDVVILTDGRFGNPEWTGNRTIRVRQKELECALKEKAGIHKIINENIPDMSVSLHISVLQNIDLNRYSIMMVPGRDDEHPDHRAAFEAGILAALKQKWGGSIFEYEVWSLLSKPTHYIAHSGEFKRNLVSSYKSQIKHLDYLSMVYGKDMYRSGFVDQKKRLNDDSDFYEVYRLVEKDYKKLYRMLCMRKFLS